MLTKFLAKLSSEGVHGEHVSGSSSSGKAASKHTNDDIDRYWLINSMRNQMLVFVDPLSGESRS